MIEEDLAGDKLAEKEIKVPRRARRVVLREVKTFEGITASLANEKGDFDYLTGENSWLARRITASAFEVWTPRHGWLFAGSGVLLNEAHPPRRDGDGREWYGAFLPDGRWVTTELWDSDRTLAFFSRDGRWLKGIRSADLAPPTADAQYPLLIGWARADKDGRGWIVHVGADGGYATVRVGPDGPARLLTGTDRWRLCYPRALGPRGSFNNLRVPDDTFRWLLDYHRPFHGGNMGDDEYQLEEAGSSSRQISLALDADDIGPSNFNPVVPGGNSVFGFWPGRADLFIGADTFMLDELGDGQPTRKHFDRSQVTGGQTAASGGRATPIVDKTWFFTRAGRCQGWARARRLADGADGRTMLFRLDDDSRVAALNPNLGVAGVRRFVWKAGETADAVQLFDDLRLGLFVHGDRLVLARW